MSIITLSADTLTATPGVGQIELGPQFYAGTPNGLERGVIPCEQFYSLQTAVTGANATGAQRILGVGVTLSAGVIYEFEILSFLNKSAGTTSHTIGISFGGTATITSIGYFGQQSSYLTAPATTQNAVGNYISNTSNTVITGALTSAAVFLPLSIKGVVSVNAAGTFIPQYSLSAAPGGAYTTAVGSYMKIKPIGASGSNVNVGIWS